MELDVKHTTKSHTWPMTSLILLCGGHEHTTFISSVQFSPLTDSGGMRDNSAEILFQTFLQDALVSSSGMGRYVHSLVLSIQHFLCQPQHCSPSRVPRRRALERLSWCVTCLNHANFHLSIKEKVQAHRQARTRVAAANPTNHY